MPNFGPEYDLATRIKRIEDWISRQSQNPLGQAFSATQSDGSLGMTIGTDPTTGATRLEFMQGTTSSRDPNTAQHPSLLYIGELVSGGSYVDSGAIFYRPTGTESVVIGNRGIQILDTKGHTVVSTDENSGEGLANPWIPLPTPAPTAYALWPRTASSSTSLMAECFFLAQHPKVYWNASVAGDAGVSGTVQATITVNGTQVSSASHSYSGTQVNFAETLTLPQPFFGAGATFAINGSVTGGTGNLYCQTWELYGRQS